MGRVGPSGLLGRSGVPGQVVDGADLGGFGPPAEHGDDAGFDRFETVEESSDLLHGAHVVGLGDLLLPGSHALRGAFAEFGVHVGRDPVADRQEAAGASASV